MWRDPSFLVRHNSSFRVSCDSQFSTIILSVCELKSSLQTIIHTSYIVHTSLQTEMTVPLVRLCVSPPCTYTRSGLTVLPINHLSVFSHIFQYYLQVDVMCWHVHVRTCRSSCALSSPFTYQCAVNSWDHVRTYVSVPVHNAITWSLTVRRVWQTVSSEAARTCTPIKHHVVAHVP